GVAARLPHRPLRRRDGRPPRLLLHVAAGRRPRPGPRGRRQPAPLALVTRAAGAFRAIRARTTEAQKWSAPPKAFDGRAPESCGRSPAARAHGLPERNVPDLIGPVARRETTQHDPGVITATRPKEKLKRPPLYKVLFHNDDYTTMEFLDQALRGALHHDEATGPGIVLHVHANRIHLAGV